MDCNSKCDDCGRFIGAVKGTSSADIYSFGVNPGCEYIHMRCPNCCKDLGPATSNARPYSGDMSPYQHIFTGEHWEGWTA